ncbi:MAG: hypothetical protein M3283_13740, partial [Actinomycetota bacterium]|nr:hypothetical protein [Actinomycetota bacterium]
PLGISVNRGKNHLSLDASSSVDPWVLGKSLKFLSQCADNPTVSEKIRLLTRSPQQKPWR